MEQRDIVAIIAIFVCVGVDVAWALLNIVIPLLLGAHGDIVPLLPGNAITDWLILWYLIPLLSIPLYVLLANISSRWLVLPLNQLLNLGHEVYYFGPETTRKQPTLTLARRAFFAVILMFGLALSITKFMPEQCAILHFTDAFKDYPIFNEMNQAIILMPLIFPFLALILPSSWLIEDTNLVFHTFPSSGPQELKNAGRTLITLLKGFAGIFVILDYFRLAWNIAFAFPVWQSVAPQGVPLWLFFIITFVNPFVYLFMPLLALILYYRFFPSLHDKFIKNMKSKGIVEIGQIVKVDVDISNMLGVKETSQD
ncbi:MAG: hypothetical protein ACFFDP_04160 [Promethearchaeota archaeon]